MKKMFTITLLAFALHNAQAQNQTKPLDVSADFPLTLEKVQKFKELQSSPISDLLGFGVSEEEIRSRTQIVKAPQAIIYLKNDRGSYSEVVVTDFKYDLFGNVLLFKKKEDKTITATNLKQELVAIFKVEQNNRVATFHLLKLQLEQTLAKLKGQKIEYQGFGEKLLGSSYLNIFRHREANVVADLYQEKTYFIFQFRKTNNNKSFIVHNDLESAKEELKSIFPEYKNDIISFIATKQLFTQKNRIAQDVVAVGEYIVTQKYPKIQIAGNGKESFEVLEVEIGN